MSRCTISITGGITERSSRAEMKRLFEQFGEVAGAWLPPLHLRPPPGGIRNARFPHRVCIQASLKPTLGSFLLGGGTKCTFLWMDVRDYVRDFVRVYVRDYVRYNVRDNVRVYVRALCSGLRAELCAGPCVAEMNTLSCSFKNVFIFCYTLYFF